MILTNEHFPHFFVSRQKLISDPAGNERQQRTHWAMHVILNCTTYKMLVS